MIIRGADVLTPDGRQAGWDIAIDGAEIAAAGPSLESAGDGIDAHGLLALPGVIDAHVHFNDPGRADWEGIPTGTAALAVGGTTLAVDMPLNASPPTLDAASFAAKAAAVAGRAHVDLALWGGLVPGNADALEELAACGVVGFKAFMSPSGIADFTAADVDTLGTGMAIAARLGLPVAVHAEDPARLLAPAGTDVRAWLDSRPIAAETSAIAIAIDLAEQTGCALHVVHVSSAAGIALVVEARARGVDVTCETCPHYLLLTAEDAERLGAAAKCAPPLRDAGEVAALWACVRRGEVDWIATDHSPAPPDMKTDPDFIKVWGGIAGAQTLLTALLDGGLDAPILARLLSTAPAKRLGLPEPVIAPGAPATLVLVDPDAEWTLQREDLRDHHRLSPFAGRAFRGRPVRTILRGETVALDGELVGPPRGQLVRRS